SDILSEDPEPDRTAVYEILLNGSSLHLGDHARRYADGTHVRREFIGNSSFVQKILDRCSICLVQIFEGYRVLGLRRVIDDDRNGNQHKSDNSDNQDLMCTAKSIPVLESASPVLYQFLVHGVTPS